MCYQKRTPQAKREMVKYLKITHCLSERRACRLLRISRSSQQYCALRSNDEALRSRLKTLATQYPAYGYLLLHGLLKQEGLVINKKHTYCLYREENLQRRTKQRKKLRRDIQPKALVSAINQRWSMDFVSDQLSDGRRFRSSPAKRCSFLPKNDQFS